LSDMDELRTKLARACQILGRLRLTKEPLGHVSVRIPGTDKILIKARGRAEAPLSFVTPEDLVVVDLDGKIAETPGQEGLSAPGEVFIHTWQYRTRPEVNSVVHVHPPTVVLFTICELPMLPIIGAYSGPAARLAKGLPTYPRSHLINSNERGEALAKVMGQAPVCLLKGHGIAAVGATIEQAALLAIDLNDLAEMNYRAALLGTPIPIHDDDFAELNTRGGDGSQQAPGPNSAWRYYDQLLR